MKGSLLMGAMTAQQIILIVVVVLLVVALIVLPMFTNKKRQKAIQELHNSISVGDTVKTVINAVDKEFVLETGLDGSKSTMVFDFNAIYQVVSKSGAKPAVSEVKNVEAAVVEPEEKPAEDKSDEK